MTLTPESAKRKDEDEDAGLAPMQHRHFATIAKIIRSMPEASRAEAKKHFASALGKTNPRFDRERFLVACEGLL